LLDQLFGVSETSGHQSTMDVVKSVVIHPELFCIINDVLQVRRNAGGKSASSQHTKRVGCLQGGLSRAKIDTGYLAIGVLIRCCCQKGFAVAVFKFCLPKSMAQIPVPVPMSRACLGFTRGARCSLLYVKLHIWCCRSMHIV